MNLLDNYYRFEQLSNSRSKSRLDLVTCTQTYVPFASRRVDISSLCGHRKNAQTVLPYPIDSSILSLVDSR